MTTISLPAGPVTPWCIGALNFTSCPDQNVTYPGVNWTTVCCDGTMVDTTQILIDGTVNTTLDIFDLLCCGGDPIGGFDMTTCSASIAPTPMASLAATNTQNALAWIDTKVSLTWNPYCVWLGSSTSVPETIVTVSKFSAMAVSTSIAFTTPMSTRSLSEAPSAASPAGSSIPASSSAALHYATIPSTDLTIVGLAAFYFVLLAPS